MKMRLVSPGGAVTKRGPLVPEGMPLATVIRVRVVLDTWDTPSQTFWPKAAVPANTVTTASSASVARRAVGVFMDCSLKALIDRRLDT
jgi:hypothetical protein